jgi:hypothetical protein
LRVRFPMRRLVLCIKKIQRAVMFLKRCHHLHVKKGGNGGGGVAVAGLHACSAKKVVTSTMCVCGCV